MLSFNERFTRAERETLLYGRNFISRNSLDLRRFAIVVFLSGGCKICLWAGLVTLVYSLKAPKHLNIKQIIALKYMLSTL